MNYSIVYYTVVFSLYSKQTPLEWAVDKGRSATVHYFVKVLGVDITQFNEVMLTHNFLFVYMFTVILG